MCRSVTLPTCGAHRPVPTNGSRSYIRFLTRNRGCVLISGMEMSTSAISGRPAINRSITAMCQAKGRNTICGRGPSSCLPHLTLLDTIHRHPPGNSPLLSGVHPAIICIIQKRPVRQGETDFHCRKRHTSGNASTIPYELRRDSNVSVCPAACYILDSIY